MERERFKTRLGFLLIAAGCAVGVGNVWKFPYVAGQSGGGLFILVYLLMLLLFGLPVLAMEFSVGRAAQRSPVLAFRELEKPGTKWHLNGLAGMLGCYGLMSFYTVVTGWMLHYFLASARGDWAGLSAGAIGELFPKYLQTPTHMGSWLVVVVAAGAFVCSFGVQKGLERVTKAMMTGLLALLVVLALHGLTMDGARAGLEFYLVPSLERLRSVGVARTVVAAATQAFFTLSLGIGAMAIFGSYIGKERSLVKESATVIALDTFVALAAGFVIFPACSTYGVDQAAGPGLIFIALPNVFAHMPGGRFWGSVFFLFMSFAAFSTILAVFEMLIKCTMDLSGWSRKKSAAVNGLLLGAISVPCLLGFGTIRGAFLDLFGGSVLDFEDFLVSNVALPLGALFYVLFCVSKRGWGWENFAAEATCGEGGKLPAWAAPVAKLVRPYCTWVLPALLLAIFAIGLYDKFFA